MNYTPMGTRERRFRRGLVLLMCAIAFAAQYVSDDDWLTWAITWGVVAGLASACWGFLEIAPSRKDHRAIREAKRHATVPPST
jgi:hypothetical protein